MEDEGNGKDLLRLYRAGSYEEMSLDRLEKVLMKVKVTGVPGAPEGVAGMIYWQGRLIAVYGPKLENGNETVSCLALIRGDGDLVYGMMADEVVGGETLDTLYG